ncbi:MAG: hypothetical protein ACRCYC_04825 [Paraclostridium sp.]|uniref:hypothetical protein n=1 Tax=Paraclostridium sp. TaxID=2023273 RepID=UPI003F2AF21A
MTQEEYKKHLISLEAYYKTLTKVEMDELEGLMDHTLGDRMCIDGVDIFKEDIIRLLNAVRSGTEI